MSTKSSTLSRKSFRCFTLVVCLITVLLPTGCRRNRGNAFVVALSEPIATSTEYSPGSTAGPLRAGPKPPPPEASARVICSSSCGVSGTGRS